MELGKDHGLLLYVMDHHTKITDLVKCLIFLQKLQKHCGEGKNIPMKYSIQLEFDHVLPFCDPAHVEKMYLVKLFLFCRNLLALKKIAACKQEVQGRFLKKINNLPGISFPKKLELPKYPFCQAQLQLQLQLS